MATNLRSVAEGGVLQICLTGLLHHDAQNLLTSTTLSRIITLLASAYI